jgi:hypothetical protein
MHAATFGRFTGVGMLTSLVEWTAFGRLGAISLSVKIRREERRER